MRGSAHITTHTVCVLSRLHLHLVVQFSFSSLLNFGEGAGSHPEEEEKEGRGGQNPFLLVMIWPLSNMRTRYSVVCSEYVLMNGQ